jgi:hypothetical protein
MPPSLDDPAVRHNVAEIGQRPTIQWSQRGRSQSG